MELVLIQKKIETLECNMSADILLHKISWDGFFFILSFYSVDDFFCLIIQWPEACLYFVPGLLQTNFLFFSIFNTVNRSLRISDIIFQRYEVSYKTKVSSWLHIWGRLDLARELGMLNIPPIHVNWVKFHILWHRHITWIDWFIIFWWF